MAERKTCNNCTHQKLVGVSITCQRCFNKSLWRARSKTMTPYKELTGEKKEKFKKWLKQFQKENDRSPTIEEVYDEATKELQAQIEKMKECANCPVWLLNQTEKNCKDCKYKEALILLRR